MAVKPNPNESTQAGLTQASHILLAIVLEVGGLAIVTAVAGISDGMANIMLVLMIGLVLLWMVTHASEVAALQNLALNIEEGAA